MLTIQKVIAHCYARLDDYDRANEIIRVRRMFLERLLRYAQFENAESVEAMKATAERIKTLESECAHFKAKCVQAYGAYTKAKETCEELRKENARLREAVVRAVVGNIP